MLVQAELDPRGAKIEIARVKTAIATEVNQRWPLRNQRMSTRRTKASVTALQPDEAVQEELKPL